MDFCGCNFFSELKVNKISKRTSNNISIDDPLQLKSYSTTDRDALTGMVAGDTIYNSTSGTIDFYNGSSWK